MILNLTYFGNPILRERASEVTDFGPAMARLGRDMIETMHVEAGIGLAGPQVGISQRIFVMEIPVDMDTEEDGTRLNPKLNGPLVVVNPQLDDFSDDVSVVEEGCLSIPEVRGNVERPWALRLRFQDVVGAPQELRLQGLAARCVQHETDHLDGVLFIDHLSAVKRLALKGRLRRIKETLGQPA
jgi:peptide deformylase